MKKAVDMPRPLGRPGVPPARTGRGCAACAEGSASASACLQGCNAVCGRVPRARTGWTGTDGLHGTAKRRGRCERANKNKKSLAAGAATVVSRGRDRAERPVVGLSRLRPGESGQDSPMQQYHSYVPVHGHVEQDDSTSLAVATYCKGGDVIVVEEDRFGRR